MDNSELNRRSFLQCAALVSASLSMPQETWSMSAQEDHLVRKHQDFLQQHAATLFSKDQRNTVEVIARHIIPSTDTPGADEAQVGRFIELMVEHWFYPSERVGFVTGLDSFITIEDKKFHSLCHAQQLAVLEKAEKQASDAAWFNLGNTMRAWDSDAPFICQIKELTVLGFLLSEIGSTQFLTPNPMGQFRGDVKLDKKKSSYAAQIPIRVLAKAVQ